MGKSGSKLRLDNENRNGVWLEKLTDIKNRVHTLVLIETGGLGIAQRIKSAQSRAKELGVPLKILNSSSAADDWVFGIRSEKQQGEGQPSRRPPPVRWLDGPEMTAWLERHYPRKRGR